MWNWDDWVLFSDQNCIFRANNKDLYGLQWGWKMENISTCLTYSPIRYFLPSYECFDPKSVVLYALLQPAYRISQCSKIIKINATKQLSSPKNYYFQSGGQLSKLQQTLYQKWTREGQKVLHCVLKNLQEWDRTIPTLVDFWAHSAAPFGPPSFILTKCSPQFWQPRSIFQWFVWLEAIMEMRLRSKGQLQLQNKWRCRGSHVFKHVLL